MMMQTRRRFLTMLPLAGATGLMRASRALATEAALETTTVRFTKESAICGAPQYVAEELLRAEGFTDIHYLPPLPGIQQGQRIARGDVDFGVFFAPGLVVALDRDVALTALAGIHVGCFELLGHGGIQSVADLKGKNVGVQALGSPPHLFASVIIAHIGIDPVNDIHWATSRSAKPIELFADGKIDAFLGLPPDPQDLRARHISHVIIVDSTVDRPWSQYFCCILVGNREFVQLHPIATKRVLRAILKATDLCAADPALAARRLVDGGFTPRYDYALQTLSNLLYKWRDYDIEDTIRFYALHLHEIGMIKASPQKIIAEGTDWRFLNELERELKA
jgi:NitT/TauT family transport system substrate-binding protein